MPPYLPASLLVYPKAQSLDLYGSCYMYVNDLPNTVTSKTRLFADDCLLYTPITSTQDLEILQEDLKSLESWQDTWLMKFNPSKVLYFDHW